MVSIGDSVLRPAKITQTDADIVLGSPLFDPRAYAVRLKREVSDSEAAQHYLDHGERDGLSPSEGFDPVFYGSMYPDVVATERNRLLHYIADGQREARYPTATALKRHTDAIRRSDKVRLHRSVDAVTPGPVDGFSVLEHNLAIGWRANAKILRNFEDLFYYRIYDDVRSSGLPAAVHYMLVGYDEGRIARQEEIDDLVDILKPHFDEDYYRDQRPELPSDRDALIDYITVGRYNGIDPSPDFSAEAYLARHPDVASAHVDAYLHFLTSGRAEGRSGRRGSLAIEAGHRPYDNERPTFVVCSHEASRSGAPLVALGIAQELAKDNNVIVLTGRSGPLSIDFKAVSTKIATGSLLGREYENFFRGLDRESRIEGVILNSVETSDVAEGAFYAGLNSIALVHEFSEYPDPRMRRIGTTANHLVFPADIVRDSFFRDVSYLGCPNNWSIRHQGRLPRLPFDPDITNITDNDIDDIIGRGNETKIVIGAGHVQIRKGVDLFVQTADLVRRMCTDDVRFIWIGSGYDPLSHDGYSLIILEILNRLDLQGRVFFLPAQAELDAVLNRADIFYLSSRLDPFPNVVLDAFAAGLPVVCFDRATGIAEEIAKGRAIGSAVNYADTAAAAQAIVEFIEKTKNVAKLNSELIRTDYSFSDYVDFLLSQMAEMKSWSEQTDGIVSVIETADVFDAAFYEGRRHTARLGRRALRNYAAVARKGLSQFNPKPGFSDNLYRSRHRFQEGEDIVPLFDALSRGEADPVTHDCVTLGDDASFRIYGGKVALHCHVGANDIASDIARLTKAVATEIDIVVSTVNERKLREVEFAFADHRYAKIQTLVVSDREQGMGSLLTGVKSVLQHGGYDVIGHFGGGESAIVGGALVSADRRWRAHGVGLLLGDGPRIDRVLSLFTDETTGLVFAEDRHSIGWTGNLPIAEALAARMSPVPLLPPYPYFPIGGMFWARTEVLRSLWALDLTTADLKAPPSPDGGTILDTIERMLPTICESMGLGWRTVHSRGAGW